MHGVPFDYFTFHVHSNNLSSPEYTGTLNVVHVNQPPTGADANYTTDMNVPISFVLDHDDIDTPLDALSVTLVDVVFGTQGTFTYSDDGTTVNGGDVRLNDWNLTFTPDTNVYSNPSDVPLGTITYRVVDDQGLSSPIYTVEIYVNFVALPITYRNNSHIKIDEDTSTSFFVDRFGIDWFGGNIGFQTVTVTADNFVGNGTLSICVAGTAVCLPIIPNSGPVTIPSGSQLRFVPAPNENGDYYYNFTITLQPPTDAPPLVVPWVIDVEPINDPPVLVPGFSVNMAEQKNYLDEDTYYVVHFDATDIDSPTASLNARFLLFLDKHVPNKLYLCDGQPSATAKVYDGECIPGTQVTDGLTWASAFSNGSFSMLFIPDPNANGETRFVIEVLDDYNAPSSPVIVDLTVLPINDPPKFDKLRYYTTTAYNVTDGSFVIDGQVSDIDFKFLLPVNLTVSVVSLNGTDLGNFSLPPNAPCNMSDDLKSFSCQAMITQINSFLAGGFDFLPAVGMDYINISFTLNDLGNIDKNQTPNVTYAWIVLNRTIAVASLQTKTAAINNTLLIVAPIAGLLAAIGIVALLFFFRGRKAASAVDDYFDRMALEMDGSVNASPLYEAAAKGGESVLYKAKA